MACVRRGPEESAPRASEASRTRLSVQHAIRDDLVAEMGHRFDSDRFVPFVVMHEFEGLLFSDCASFSRGIYRAELQGSFQEIRDGFNTPEDINDSPITAPSKRVKELVPGYEKPLLGVLAVFGRQPERLVNR